MFRKGLLVVISGPSGTGKGTVLKFIKEANDNIRYSVSATTRKPREGEIDGVNYFFKTIEEFKAMIERDELIEWVQYCDNYYGTPREFIDQCINNGLDVILEIEVEGALNIRDRFPECITIFILPPSFKELVKRIENRGTEKVETINKRMNQAKRELTYVHKYDYIVVNDKVEEAVKDINSILLAEKLRFKRNKDLLKNLDLV